MNHRVAGCVGMALLVLSVLVVPARAQAPASLKVEKNARVVLMGNGLGSRMVHFGHFETGMHLRYPGHNLVIRNMCDEGNTPSFRPHSGRQDQLGFPGADKFYAPYADGRMANGSGHFETEEQWLARLKPDVLIVFFGFNESFLGSGGLKNFQAELDAFLKHTIAQKYNGRAVPQIALVSPTAYQNLSGVMDVPAGEVENANLATYTAVMEKVAAENGVLFVNAFNASLDWYKATKDPLTADGALLNDAGYRKLAGHLIDRVFGASEAKAEAHREKIHAAVMDKNWLWINDFKIPNGVHVFGQRYNPFGPKNYPFEIAKIREMTEIRDRAVWAAAQGQSLDVAALDVRTAVLPEVPTNYKPGGKNGELTYLKGAEALATIQVPQGFKIEQWATEQEFPFLQNPVQLSFDNKGRLWVAVMPSYPHWRPGDPMPDDKLLILEDTNNDGKADKQTVFADKLHLPMGFELAPEGVYVSQGINLVLLRDTNGDNQADSKEIIFSGFDDHDTHHAISAYCADPSGAIFMCEGVFLRTSVETAYGPVRGTNGGFYRFDPKRRQLERHAQLPIPNPWGVAFDDWGQHFYLYTSGPDTEWMLPGSVKPRYGVEMPRGINLIEPAHRVRPTSGIEFISSRHFPDEMQGDMILNNTIGFRGTKQHKVEEDGTGYKTSFRQDLTNSSDGNFRPVDLEIAPDGSLFIVDWHNPLIGHMQHNARDPHRDHAHGRIYRITYPSRPLVEPAKIDGASIAQLLENLKLPEFRTRYRTRRELRGRDPEQVLSAVKKWTAGLNAKDPGYEHQLLEALWVTWGLNRVDDALLRRLLEAKDYRARAAAVRVVRYNGHRLPDQAALLEKAATDPHGRVKLEAITAASWIGQAQGLAVLDAAVRSVTGGGTPSDTKAEHVKVTPDGRVIRIAHPATAAAKISRMRITVPGRQRTINLAEMEIHGSGQNLTSRAKLKQQSEYNGGQFPIGNLVDGNKDNFSHTAEATKDPWIEAAFDEPVGIGEVVIWNRGGFEDRFDGAQIVFYAGNQTVAEATVHIVGGGKGNPFANDPWIKETFRLAQAHLHNETVETKEKIDVPGHLKGKIRETFVKGAEIYRREGFCGTCHQPDGNGLALAGFPPLAESEWVTQSPERLIKLTLNGLHGPIEVKGKAYPGLVPMTPFAGMLNDADIAAVLTYVRNSFNNKASEITADQVKQVRAATKDKAGFYAPEELLKLHPNQ